MTLIFRLRKVSASRRGEMHEGSVHGSTVTECMRLHNNEDDIFISLKTKNRRGSVGFLFEFTKELTKHA